MSCQKTNGPPLASCTSEMVIALFTSDRNQNNIPVSRRIAGADQTNRVGHTFLKLAMRFEADLDAATRLRESVLRALRIRALELLRHVNRPRFKVREHGIKNLTNRGTP